MSAPRHLEVADVPRTAAFRDGDRVTIAGFRVRKDGSLTTHCKPGNETTFIVRKVARKHPLISLASSIR